jgi:hypothetical protein
MGPIRFDEFIHVASQIRGTRYPSTTDPKSGTGGRVYSGLESRFFDSLGPALVILGYWEITR